MKTYKNPTALVARLAEIHAERRAVQKIADDLKTEEETLLQNALVLFTQKDIPVHEIEGVGKLRIGTQPIATIQSWPSLLKIVADHANDERYTSCIHKRTSPTAIEKLAFENVFLDGVLLEHKKVAVFTAAREKKS